ncbi:MAG: toxin-antitoxin system YwqK family antitoxin, partial [Candidatus Latescibacterota bacterium]
MMHIVRLYRGQSMHQLKWVWCVVLFFVACGPDLQVVQEEGVEYQVYLSKDTGQVVRHGYFKAFYESGNPKTVGQYAHGMRSGLWTNWHENGQKQGEMDWVEGHPKGMVIEWYENGQKKNEGFWKDNGRHGLSTWWYDTGIKEKEVT